MQQNAPLKHYTGKGELTMTENINKVRSVTIKATYGGFGTIFDRKEQSQTLTVYRDGKVCFSSHGAKTDEYGHVVYNALIRRIVRRIEQAQADKIFDDFETVLKPYFEGGSMARFMFAGALADEFVIRYDNADFFYGMSYEESTVAVARVYGNLREVLGISALLDLDCPANDSRKYPFVRKVRCN